MPRSAPSARVSTILRIIGAIALSLAGHATDASAAARSVSVGPRAGTVAAPLRIECPVNQPTRLVISRPFRRLVVRPPTAVDPLGISVVAAKPEGVVRVQPVKHPSTGEMHIQLADRVLVLVLKTTAQGVGSDLRLELGEPSTTVASSSTAATPAPRPIATATPSATRAASVPTFVPSHAPTLPPTPPAKPLPTVRPSVSPTPRATATPVRPAKPSPSPTIASPSPSPATTPTATPGVVEASASPSAVPSLSGSAVVPSPSPSVNLDGLLSAKTVSIGRREGLPGQKPMVLDDALKGERSVWFRFSLLGGAKEEIVRVTMGKKAIPSFTQKAENDNLRIVVQLAAGDVTKDASLTFELRGGRKYHFARLTTPTLTNLLKRF